MEVNDSLTPVNEEDEEEELFTDEEITEETGMLESAEQSEERYVPLTPATAGDFMEISNVVGIVLLVGSGIMRFRPVIQAAYEAQQKYFRKEKKRQMVYNLSLFGVVFCLILLIGWFLLFRDSGNNFDKSESTHTPMSTSILSLPVSGGLFGASSDIKLSVSDIIAIIIVILSLALFSAKQIKRTKPVGSSYLSRYKTA